MPPKIAVVAGPTATGKTRLGVELALELGGEIVSADSMQIYRGMDIGTAKPTPEETRGVAHHMIDVALPEENWSVARYVEAACACVDDILARGRLPIIVGGTGLYIDSLISGRDFADRTGDGQLRALLSERYDALGGAALLGELAKVDPDRAAKLAEGDKRRIVRALEVFYLTGRTITQHDEETKSLPARYDADILVLSFSERAHLYERIDRRVDDMVEAGLFHEVRSLLDAGVSRKCTAMQAIGYKEAGLALDGELTQEEATEIIKRSSRRYAKRQLTWFRRYDSARWLLWEKMPDFDFARQFSTDYFSGSDVQ